MLVKEVLALAVVAIFQSMCSVVNVTPLATVSGVKNIALEEPLPYMTDMAI
jgi:hypothetical protein